MRSEDLRTESYSPREAGRWPDCGDDDDDDDGYLPTLEVSSSSIKS